jgi:hypothetical protein
MTLKIRKLAFVVALGITASSVNLTFNFDAQSKYEEKMLDELLSTDKNIGLRWFPRAKLAESVAQDKTLSPKIRVDILTAVLREEIDNPCPTSGFNHGGHLTPTALLKRNYVRALAAVGTEAIPYLKPYLAQLKLSVEEAAGDSEYQKWLNMEEMQHIRFALGLLGDMDVFPHVLALLEDDSVDGYVREMAARVLENLKNDAAIPALTHALNDDFHVEHELLGHPRTSYPVRWAAYGALTELGLRVGLSHRGDVPHFRVLEPPNVSEICKFLAASDLIAVGTVVKYAAVGSGESNSSLPSSEFVASLNTVQVEEILYAEREIKDEIFFKDGAERDDLAEDRREPNRISFVDHYKPFRGKWQSPLSTNEPYLFFLKFSDLPKKYPDSYLHNPSIPKIGTVASLHERSIFEPALDSIDSTLDPKNEYEKTWLPYVEVLGEAMSEPDWQRKERRFVELSNDRDEILASNARNLLAILRERVREQ